MEGHFFPRPARRQTAGLALGSCSRQDLPLGSGMVVFLLDYRGLAGEENQGGGGCGVSFFEKGSEEALLSVTSCMERLDPSHALWESDQDCLSPKHSCWDLGFALLLSLMQTKPCKEESVHRWSQTHIFPVISRRLYWGTLSKDLAFIIFTLDFSFQSVSLSHFILNKYAKSVRTVYL